MQQQMSASEYYEHGLVLKKVRMFNPAIDDFQKATLDPDIAGKAHLQIAFCLRTAGRHAEAVMAFRQALAAGTFSPVEHRHILYLLGQTLESLNRHDESLEIYEVIKREDPTFHDVALRSQHLSDGGRGPVPPSHGQWHAWTEEMLAQGRQVTPHLLSFLEQTGQWMRRRAEELKRHPLFERVKSASRKTELQPAVQPSQRPMQTALRSRAIESRRHPRTSVRLKSHFSAKGRMEKGDGELRDLSPWGCRVTSPVAVSVGISLECCIFPQDAANPFIIDGATVRWINAREFGLSFTSVRPGVQRQIAQLCRTQAA